MPISSAEKTKLRSHTFSEDKREEFTGTHLVPPDISVLQVLTRAFDLLLAKPSILLWNIPAAAILAWFVYSVLGQAPSVLVFSYSLAFFVLGVVLVAPLDALAKSRLASLPVPNLFDSAIVALNYVAPLVSIGYLAIVAIVLRGLGGFWVFTEPVFLLLTIVVLAVTVLLHAVNLKTSLGVFFACEKKLGRSAAIGRSWMLLNGQTYRLITISALCYFPVAVAVFLFSVYNNQAIVQALALVTFLAGVFSASWWQACSACLYALAGLARQTNYEEV